MNIKDKTAELVSLYTTWASVPTVKWGKIIRTPANDICILSKWSSYHAGHQEKTTFKRSFLRRTDTDKHFVPVGFPVDSSNEKLLSVSPSRKFFSIIRKCTDKKGEKQQFLEIWTSDYLWKSWDLTALNVHGDVNDDVQFGCLQWSPDETKLVYVAEKKQPKSVPFFSQKPSDNSGDADQELGIGQYREEWGEQLVGKHHPVACIFDIGTSEITVIDLVDKSCGQVIWGPQGESLICIGWDEEPRRLGLIFCTNRKSSLYMIDLKNGNAVSTLYEAENRSCLSPRLSPDSQTVVFLEVPATGPHRACSRLCKINVFTKKHYFLVDTVAKSCDEGFPGIYCEKLVSNCFSHDGEEVFLTSPWRSQMAILCITTKAPTVHLCSDGSKGGSWSLLDISDNMILAVRSAPNLKPHLVFARLPDSSPCTMVLEWAPVENVDHTIPGVSWKITDIEPEGVSAKASVYQAITITPNLTQGQKYPLVVIPHGGPHSVMDASYSLFTTLFVKLNFAVLAVNYRGSLGFGDNVLRSLLGSVGDTDVKDVQQAVKLLLSEEWVDPSQIILFGGSHGGFLSTHLIGQYPDFYRACICRNPVVDISGKLEGTDIPDWGFAESGQQEKFSFSTLPEPEIRKIMWDHSPYQFIEKVKTPVLLLIGRNDLRVPPTQGINYYHTLKSLGKVCQMYVYDDNHSLSGGKVESDSFVRTGLWIFQHLEK